MKIMFHSRVFYHERVVSVPQDEESDRRLELDVHGSFLHLDSSTDERQRDPGQNQVDPSSHTKLSWTKSGGFSRNEDLSLRKRLQAD